MGQNFSLFNTQGNHFHQIIPNLYIGDCDSIYQTFFTQQSKIIVINATPNIKFNKKIKSTMNYRVNVEDDLKIESNTILYDEINHVGKIINHYLNQNYTVLVHCIAGRQRSCALVTGYLMKYKNYELNNAIYFIKRRRPFAFFGNVNFKTALINYQYDLLRHKIN